jgi:tetratricopeptide (TPR) repeat protein
VLARAAAEEAIGIAAAAGDAVTALRAARAASVARLVAGDAAAALAAIEPHIAAAAQMDDASAHAELLTDYALLLERTDRRDEAVALYDRAAELARDGNNLIAAQVAMANAAVSCVYLGRLGEALARSERAIQLASEMESDSISLAIDRINRGGMLIQVGRFGEALELLESALPVVERAGAISWWLMAAQHLALLWAVLGQPGRAKQVAVRVPCPESPSLRVLWHGLRLRVCRWMEENAASQRDALHSLLGAVPLLSRQRLPIEIELCRGLPAARSALRLRNLAKQAREQQQIALALTADGLGISQLLLAGEHALAASLAARWLIDCRTAEPYDIYLPEVLLVAARALGGDDASGAQLAIDRASTWIEQAAAGLPAALRDAFLARNLTNRHVANWTSNGPLR